MAVFYGTHAVKRKCEHLFKPIHHIPGFRCRIGKGQDPKQEVLHIRDETPLLGKEITNYIKEMI